MKRLKVEQGRCNIFSYLFFIVRAKKQCGTSLCHSLVPHTYVDLYLRDMLTQFTYSAFVAPNSAIIPIPISMASSSILKVGVCPPMVIPFAIFPVPNLKKQPGIL